MSQALIARIDDAYGEIYNLGDSGLDYMDRHPALIEPLMEHLYASTMDTLSEADLVLLADSLDLIADDAVFALD